MSKSARPERAARRCAVLLALGLALLASPLRAAAADQELRLLRVTPTGDDVEAGRQIVLAFDRPVVPLGRMDRKRSEVPVSITPQLPCEWRWLDPQTLACQLPQDEAMREATAYSVDVQPGFVTEKGERLAAASTWHFTTRRPALHYAGINTWEAPGLPVVRVYFDQPVSQASVAASFAFDKTAAMVMPERLDPQTPWYLPAAGDEPVGEARRTWLLKPKEPLPADHDGALRVAPGLRSAFGEAHGVEHRVALKFHTFPDFAFLGLRCTEPNGGGELRIAAASAVQSRLCDPLAGVALIFSAPLLSKDLHANLALNPDPASAIKDRDPWADAPTHVDLSTPNREHRGYEVRLPFTFKADAEYTLDGQAALADVFGRALGAGWKLAFRTAHRSPKLTFEHTTAVLEQDVDSEVPVIVTNLKTLDARFNRITAAGVTQDRAQVPVTTVRDLAFAMPLGVRQMLGGAAGVVDGRLRTDPATLRDEADSDDKIEKTRGAHFFAEVTPWQVHVKLGHYNTLAWVTEFASGKPVVGAEVSLYAAQKDNWQPASPNPASAQTDADGVASLPGRADIDPKLEHSGWRPKQPLALRVTKDRDFALVPLGEDFNVDVYRASRYQVSAWQRPQYGHLKAWGTTAQGVYRAGDTIQYKVYVRSDANRGLAPAPAGPYTLRVLDPADQVVHERADLQLSGFGAVDGEFTVPKQGKVGWYRFALIPQFAKAKPKSADEVDEGGELAPMRVLVSDFTPAPFRLATEIRAARASPGDKLVASLRASLQAGGAYSGAPATLAARIVAKPLEPEDPLASRFTFGSYEDEARDQRSLSVKESQTDAAGEFSAALEIPENDIAWGALVVEGSAQDDRGRSIAATASVPYSGRDRYIGLLQKDWLLKEGTPTEVDTLVIDAAGKPAAGSPTYVRIERRETVMARVKDVGNAYVARYSERWQNLHVCKGRSAAELVACKFTPDVGGSYRVTAMTRDTHNRLHTSSLWLWASGKNTFLWEEPDDYGLELVPDKKSYKVGERARFLVKNPYPGATALVTTERYGVIEHHTQVLQGSAPVVEVPVTADLLPGFYLSVVVQSPRVEKPPPEGDVDLGKPTFRMGYAKVAVDDPYKTIAVKVTPEREQYKPREIAKVRLVATPNAAAPGEKIELAVAVIDAAVFDLIQGRAAYFDPREGFAGFDPLDLANYSLLTRLVGRQKFEKKGATPGGDGGVDLALRSVEKFVAYWNPALATDANGAAEFEFTLPDNLTAWKVMALAVTPGDRLGLGSGTIKASKDTELRPVMPNQVSTGDKFQAGFSVLNRTGTARTLKVALKAEGAAQASREEIVSLAGFERKTVFMDVAATQAGDIVFTASAGDAQDRDALRQVLPVKPRKPTVTAASYGVLDEGAGVYTQPLDVPAASLPGGEIAVSFAPSVLGNLDGAFKYVRDYPYLCWEQRLTKAVMAADLQRLKPYLDPKLVWPEADALVAQTFADAGSFQAANGGMGFWDADEAHVSPYLSAYTALAFEWLRKAGHPPPQAVQDKLDRYLDQLLRKDVPDYSLEASSSVRAVALSALAQRGKLKRADLERYAPALPRMGLFGQSLFLEAALETAGAEASAQSALKLLLAHGQESAGSLVLSETDDSLWNLLLGSPLRSNCAALSALLALPGKSLDGDASLAALPMKLVRAITQARGGRDHWENTQENVFCLAALDDYAHRYESVAPSLNLKAALDAQPLGEAKFSSVRDAPVTLAHPIAEADIGKKQSLAITREGEGRAYFTARLSYVEKDENASAVNAGLALKRSYSVKREGHWQALASPMTIKRGELVRVELTLSAPSARYFVVVDDPLPGGLEPVNPDLATASGLAAEEAEPPGSAYPYPFYHRELRFDAARFFADALEAGEYKLYWIGQAVATGEFAVPASHAEEMYDPEVFGNDVASKLVVEAAAPPNSR